MRRDYDAIIVELANRQRGYVERRQLIARGVPAHVIDRRIASGMLIRGLRCTSPARTLLDLAPTLAATHRLVRAVNNVQHEADERVIVECDSWEYHRFKSVFVSDRLRDLEHKALDYLPIRITWDMLVERPDWLARQLHTILARRRRELASSSTHDGVPTTGP
jgi:hypothetical protein